MAAIIFDFDGTIADSFDYVSNFLAVEAGIAPLSEAQKQGLRGLSIPAMVRHMGNGRLRSMWLFLKGRHWMERNIHSVGTFHGVPDVIKKLHSEGHELFILTSNNTKTVGKFLRHYKLHKYFLEIYGGASIFGKAPALRSLLKEQKIEKEDSVYVGDELRDVQAAQAVGMRVVAVGWGFARLDDLKKQKPTAIAGTPDELLQILENI